MSNRHAISLCAVLCLTPVLLLAGCSAHISSYSSGSEPEGEPLTVSTVGTGIKSGDVDTVIINCDVGNVSVTSDDVDELTLDIICPDDNYTYACSGGTFSLDIHNNTSNGLVLGERSVDVKLPRDTELEKLEITVENGDIYLCRTDAANLTAKTTLGSFSNYGAFSGNADIKSGSGNIDLILKGSESDYSCKLTSNFGRVIVNNVTYRPAVNPHHRDMGSYTSHNYSGSKITADCSSGTVTVKFA